MDCISKAPAKAGLGLDSWRPRDWEHLPAALVEGLTSILQEIDTGLSWPSQVLQVLLAFIPKPTGGNGPSPSWLAFIGCSSSSANLRWHDGEKRRQGFGTRRSEAPRP
jgi:hypothetical protein